ncbi:MAG: PDZ domain-containing protein [Bauldia sp.]|uniref:S41 family peptidase n=1 Tax=Bauldia sp. TaxID=2575872 RepID=UPI001E17C9AA|nr:S41 family peptidase [Bauldia sp.]MCB1497686.1 PDZ domain-containing protein [Bauldia sp.]
MFGTLTSRLGAAALALTVSVASAGAAPARNSGNALFDRAVELIERNFYAPEALTDFNESVALTIDSLGGLGDAEAAVVDDAIDFVAASLGVSHTGRFTRDQLAYYELADVFRYGLRDRLRRFFPPDGDVTYDGIGIASTSDGGQVFITDIYDGTPADRAGLLAGDEILAVDGAPFSEIGSFRDKAGQSAVLSIRRTEGGPRFDVSVPVARLSPAETFVSAIADSAEVIERDGYRIGYLRLWAYTERRIEGIIEAALAGPLAGTDGLVLDLRSRWGGAPADAADTFVGGSPEMTMVYRGGESELIHTRWDKPIVAIIDEGTRSGMEILAYALKQNGVRLIGETTAGDVLAGRAFWLPDGSILEIAVADVMVDGERLEHVGVAPDIAVPFDIRYAAGRDEQLAAALGAMTHRLATGFPEPRTP